MSSRRVRQVLAALLFAAVTLVVLLPGAWAQNYGFNLSENQVELFINGDGQVRIVYDLTFVCDPGAHPIDVVDIGLPNDSYRLSEIQASIGGVSLTDISDSPYVKPGVAVGLGRYAIQPGQTGTLHFEATIREMIYQDSKDNEYASIEFAPTWFDSDFVHGTTYLVVSFHFPIGVTADEPRYHDREFTTADFQDDRVVYTWINDNASGSTRYVFGASFPAKYVAEGVVQKAPAFSFNLGALCSSPLWWILFVGAGWLGMGWLGSRARRRRKMDYLPPSLAVEGTGVKRGLTAVEAAILLEAPLDKVMIMILFGLLKKGILTVESEKPLKVRLLADGPAGDLSVDVQGKDVKLWYYERRFLQAIRDDGTMNESALREMVIDLIGDVNKKLSGFSRKETVAYYRDVAARAWKQVEAAETPEVLGQRWGEGLEWTMLEDDWDDRTRRVFHDRPVVIPSWWWGYEPWVARSGPSVPSVPRPSPAGAGTPVTLPTLPGADFANTVVGGIENAANTVVSSVEGFTGRITQKTNPPPKPSSSSSSRRGGGYSCACACACAGCACACAGGGR